MIIARTPYRVSFFGGGTDYPAWYRENGGAVLGTAIDKYCHVTIRHLPPFFEHKHRIVYSKVETVAAIDEIEHPSVRAVLTYLGIHKGVEIHHDGDLPARTGLGSSSSFTCGMYNAASALLGRMHKPSRLADEVTHIEQNLIGENVGDQDQIWAAYGGTNYIEFRPDGSRTVSPLVISADRRRELESHLVMVFTGFARFADAYAKNQIDNIPKRHAQLRNLQQMADEAFNILISPDREIGEFGRLMAESWRNKREIHETVSTDRVDEIYEAGIAAGAYGGKLLGAGGGGFMLFVVPPERKPALLRALSDLVPVEFKIGAPGSTIVLYEPNGWDAAAHDGPSTTRSS